MAELVGLVASIATIASMGLATAKAISVVADELGSAGREIRGIGIGTKAVALILHKLKQRLDKPTKLCQRTFDVANEIVDLCKENIHYIEQLLVRISPPDKGRIGLRKTLRWFREKPKIAARLTSLDSLKITLDLFLHTLDFIEGDAIEEGYVEAKIKSLIAESQNTKSKFIQAERIDQVYEAHISNQQAGLISNDDDGIEDAPKLLHSDPQSAGDATALVKRRNSIKDENDGNETGVVDNTLRMMEGRYLDNQTTELDVLGSISCDQLLHIAQHVRTQQTVSSHSLAALDRGYGNGFATAAATSESPQESSPENSTKAPDGVETLSGSVSSLSESGPATPARSSTEPRDEESESATVAKAKADAERKRLEDEAAAAAAAEARRARTTERLKREVKRWERSARKVFR